MIFNTHTESERETHAYLCDVHRGEVVDLHHLLKDLGLHLLKVPRLGRARVAHQEVHSPPKESLGLRERLERVLCVAEVARDARDLGVGVLGSSRGLDLLNSLV